MRRNSGGCVTWLCLVLAASPVWAQSAPPLPLSAAAAPATASLTVTAVGASPGPSVADLIEEIKLQHELSLSPPQGRSRSTLSAQRALPHAVASEAPPLLWSLSGLNGDYSAVLVIGRKVHAVRSADLPQRVGGWQVQYLSAHSVCVSRRERQLCLPAPDSASSVQPFVRAFSLASEDRTSASSSATPGQALRATGMPAESLSQALAARLPSLPVPGGGASR